MIASMTNSVHIWSIQQFWWDIKRKILTCFLSWNFEREWELRVPVAPFCPLTPARNAWLTLACVCADATPHQSHFLPVTQYGTGRHVDLCVERNVRKW